MICLRKMANCVSWDMPWLESDEVMHECYLAAHSLQEKYLPHYARAVICDAKNIFTGRKWQEAKPQGERHIRYMRSKEPESPEGDWCDTLTAEQLMMMLPEQQRQVLYGYYWRGLTFAAIADKLGVDRFTASRWHKRAIEAMRSFV